MGRGVASDAVLRTSTNRVPAWLLSWHTSLHNCDHRTPSSVIIRRTPDAFQDLFAKQSSSEPFDEGLELRASKRAKPLSYHPASGTLSRLLAEQRIDVSLSVPDVLAITSQFKPLVDIWTECIEELRAYDKAHRTVAGWHARQRTSRCPRSCER